MILNRLHQKFWGLPLNELTDLEWAALYDGFSRCCLKKFLGDETEELFWTRIAIKHFDNSSRACSCYEEGTELVVDCLYVRYLIPKHMELIPSTCAHRLRTSDKTHFDWHPLLSKNSSSVISFGISIQNKSNSEKNIHSEGYPEHIVRWVD